MSEVLARSVEVLWPDNHLPVLQPRSNFWEIFSPLRIARELRFHGMLGTRAIDKLNGWDLSEELDHWTTMLSELLTHRPYFTGLEPPCTYWSTLMSSNWFRMPVAVREARANNALWLLCLACAVAQYQVANNGFYFLEHPKKSTAWQHISVRALPRETVVFDMCMLGLKSPKGVAMRKETMIKTNSPKLVEALSKVPRCKNGHTHISVQGKEDGVKLSTWSQVYPLQFCQVIADAVVEELQGN